MFKIIKKGKVKMRKRVGYKVIGMLMMLFIVFLINNVAQNLSSANSKDAFVGKTVETITAEDFNQNTYEEIDLNVGDILRLANRYYDIVLVDLEGNIDEQNIKEILEKKII